jgi:hypothetical protein
MILCNMALSEKRKSMSVQVLKVSMWMEPEMWDPYQLCVEVSRSQYYL